MIETEFQKHLQKRGLSGEDIKSTITAVEDYEAYLEKRKTSLESASLNVIRAYILL